MVWAAIGGRETGTQEDPMFEHVRVSMQQELEEIEEAGLTKNERIIISPQGAQIRVAGGAEVSNFCANNYLGLANHPTLAVQYVSHQDISKMVIRKYSGWWDDLPSDWSPAAREAQAALIVELAGGIDPLVERARAMLEVRNLGDGIQTGEVDMKLASHMAEWAWLSHPENPGVQQLVLDAFKARILDPESNTQEMLAYLDRMTEARQRQLEAE